MLAIILALQLLASPAPSPALTPTPVYTARQVEACAAEPTPDHNRARRHFCWGMNHPGVAYPTPSPSPTP